jgi:hypothetical protein
LARTLRKETGKRAGTNDKEHSYMPTARSPLPVLLAVFSLAACEAETFTIEGDEDFEYTIDGDMAIPHPLTPMVFSADSGAGPKTVYLNFDGARINVGGWAQNNAQTNTSFIPERASDVPAFNHRPWGSNRADVIGQVVARVRADYDGYGINFVTQRPASGNYTMIVVGGHPEDIGESGPIGIAPLDRNNWNQSDVGFVFSARIADFRYSAAGVGHCISHELAHSVGLRHIDRGGDHMYPSLGHRALTWGAGAVYENPDEYQDDRAVLATAYPDNGPETEPEPEPQPQPPAAQTPIGYLDEVFSDGRVWGWTCDPDRASQSIYAYFYVGGPANSGAPGYYALAHLDNEQAVTDACGGGAAHRFYVQLPNTSRGTPIHAYGRNEDGWIYPLTDSPKVVP